MHALRFITATLLVASAGVVALVVAGFGIAPSSESTLVVGLDSQARSLDPHVTTRASDFRVLTSVYEGLVGFAEGSLEPAPALAESWSVSDDGTRYTFKLKPGVRFHDGTPLDAAAVKFNFQRMLDANHPFHHTGPFPLSFFFERVREIAVVDRLRVAFSLDAPFAPLLSNLAYPTGFIVSEAAIRAWGKDVGRHPVGTGPFRFQQWDGGHRIVLTRNEDYHGNPARLAQVVFRPISDPMTRVAELRARRVDVVPELSPDSVAWFRDTSGFSVTQAAGPHLWFVILNTQRAPFDDVRVRQAVNLAVNKRELVASVLQGTASVAAGPIASAFGAAAGQVRPYPFDPPRARQLLAEAGVKDGTKVTLVVPTSGSGMLAPVQMATAIQADLAAIGINVELQTYDWNSYLTKVNSGLDTIDMAAMAWMTNDPDTLPYLALRSAAHPPHGFNSGWYANRQVDRLLLDARNLPEPAQRAHLYAQVQQLVHDEAPWLFVASWKQNLVAHNDVLGMRVEPSFLLHLSGVSKQ